jgi:hypothetical protein
MAQSRRLPKILVLTDGRELRTLSDARALILALPEDRRHHGHWEYVEEMLTGAIQGRGAFVIGAFNAQLKRALKADGLIT